MNSQDVPMMFRAQIGGRCQIQRVDTQRTRNDEYQDAEIWVDEWMAVFDYYSNKDSKNTLKLPGFGSQVKLWEYKIKWRLVSNSGQDEGVIRPIIGARGFPYFSGASMKGAFIRACKQKYGKEQGKKEAEKYCGKKLSNGSSEPGILRFHGAYPINMDWTENPESLVDVIHSQQEKQVIQDKITNANSQISLYQSTLKFGFSSNKNLDDSEWRKIKEIWEITLANGLGSRVSAGYGYFIFLDNTLDNTEKNRFINRSDLLLSIKLKGQGAASKLVNKITEFRPNMFKAALRGHTLRLLAGMTDERTAKDITNQLWGGFGKRDSIVGKLGVDFNFDSSQIISTETHPGHYELSEGTLNIFCMHPQINDADRKILENTAKALVKFAMLFGGFGKSWRRVCHKEFDRTYFDDYPEKVIGCHWQYLNVSEYYSVDNLEVDIPKYIQKIRDELRVWIDTKPQNKRIERDRNLPNQNNDIVYWREAWYSPKVEVWAHFAKNGKSQAIRWFHDSYNGHDTIKASRNSNIPNTLAGSMGYTGRIWHRMYPHFITNNQREIVRGEGYVEILTIFPDESDEMKNETEKFLNFLRDKTEFIKVC
ncbi:RAMP superfamily CRISPR-associated protein [Nostoc sp. CCY0012]|uniref:RAMP superfamily CRISPR-associated protein n=1 Tax=Nostoc sp. CCY0012 TaxID=1056123 RepID=UPI0039C5ED28